MPNRVVRIQLVCQWPECQSAFEIIPARFRAKPQRFCSRTCLAKYMKSCQDTGTLADHFWQKVFKGLPHDCWPWQASKGGSGYGVLYVLAQHRLVGAHVVSWFLHHGVWPPEGMQVLHNCPTGDNRACVNIAHLWLGTQKDNQRDMSAKGRHSSVTRPNRIARGERHGTHTKPESVRRGASNNKTKLTDAQREEVATLYATGKWALKHLATRFGVSDTAIRRWALHNK